VQGTSSDYRGKKFVIGMIHTLSQQAESFPTDFYSYFGSIIYDEVHLLGAEHFSIVGPMFTCKVRIGLSATVYRKDGADGIFLWHIGAIVASCSKYQAIPKIRMFPYRGTDTAQTGCVWKGRINLGRYYNRVGRSVERNRFLSRIIKKLDDDGHDILILSDRIEQLESLQFIVKELGVHPDKIGKGYASFKQHDKKIIFGSYGAMGIGVNIPRFTALVMATPRADVVQNVGRVLRKGTPIVVDIVDMTSGIMVGWARARMKFYNKLTKDIIDKTGVIY
jgi:superfamily II DNA or RNA helicase